MDTYNILKIAFRYSAPLVKNSTIEARILLSCKKFDPRVGRAQ